MDWPLVESRKSFRELHEFLEQRNVELTMADYVLPYPAQLPQDYYAKGLPPVPPLVTPPPLIPSPIPPPEQPITPPAVNNGGVYYGDSPPGNPANGWLWTNRLGVLYVYMEPGVWSQIGTNW